jgi:hypothetical protein
MTAALEPVAFERVLELLLTCWPLKIIFMAKERCSKAGRQTMNNLLCYQVFYKGYQQRLEEEDWGSAL